MHQLYDWAHISKHIPITSAALIIFDGIRFNVLRTIAELESFDQQIEWECSFVVDYNYACIDLNEVKKIRINQL